jgi:hypothetical protein
MWLVELDHRGAAIGGHDLAKASGRQRLVLVSIQACWRLQKWSALKEFLPQPGAGEREDRAIADMVTPHRDGFSHECDPRADECWYVALDQVFLALHEQRFPDFCRALEAAVRSRPRKTLRAWDRTSEGAHGGVGGYSVEQGPEPAVSPLRR